MTVAMMGSQTPTFQVTPEIADDSLAEDALELAKIVGLELLPWQIDQVRAILGLRADGDYAATRAGLAVPRQNGKGVVLEVIVLAKTILLGEKVLWSAHEWRTTVDSFRRFRALIDGVPSLASKVTYRLRGGDEQTLFDNGAMVRFSARSKSATRGLGFRTIVADEAQELDFLALSAMVPTLSGQRDAPTQLVMTGTAPYSRAGEVFKETRAAAHTGGDARLSWTEWAAERFDASTDRSVWSRTNPSLGVIVMPDKIESEWAAMQARPDEFRRERLGEWGRSGEAALALDETQWAKGGAAWPERDARFIRQLGPNRMIGIDCTWNAEMTYLVEAVPLEQETVGLEVLAAAPGLEWVSEKMKELREGATTHAVFDPLRTGDLTTDLLAAGVPAARIYTASGKDLSLACDGLVRLAREGRLRHHDPRLDAAAAGATRSTFDDGRGWKLVGINGTDVSPLIAGGLAARLIGNEVKPRRTESERQAIVL